MEASEKMADSETLELWSARDARAAAESVFGRRLPPRRTERGCFNWRGRGGAKGAVRAMDAVTSDDVLDQAYAWLCGRRHEAPFWHDVWHVRWRWADLKPTLRQQLLNGSFRLGPTRTVQTDDGAVEAWSVRDAIVLKAVAIVLGQRLDGGVAVRIGEYVRRWLGWVRGRLGFDVCGSGSFLQILNTAVAYHSCEERLGIGYNAMR